MQSYGTRCVKPPIVWGDVSRREPITVARSSYAQSRTNHVVKGMLTGPVTILNWSWPREDVSNELQTVQLALAIRDEVLDTERAGIRVIQIDEAALREKLPLRKSDWHKKYLDWAIPAFRLVHAAVQPTTQIHTHMCYSEFNDIIRDIDAMDADVISFEASRGDWWCWTPSMTRISKPKPARAFTTSIPRASPRSMRSRSVSTRSGQGGCRQTVDQPRLRTEDPRQRGDSPSLKNMVEATRIVRARLAAR